MAIQAFKKKKKERKFGSPMSVKWLWLHLCDSLRQEWKSARAPVLPPHPGVVWPVGCEWGAGTPC